jgi:bifunctional UDP-N-acetylglucosamine pyrophosphorylase/glucosamine-1-phosphate N-acetyltransferase
MPPVLVIPAAGRGSRLDSSLPKFLFPVAGRPMIDWLLDLYRDFVSRVIVVVSPGSLDRARAHLSSTPLPVDLEVQEQPTGMLDAVLKAQARVQASRASRIWITWCDQVAIGQSTVETLARLSEMHHSAAIVMPVAVRREPYIHFVRDADGRIRQVLQRREGDEMPEVGESDAGLFSFSRDAFLSGLPDYARRVHAASESGERNLLPFVTSLTRPEDLVTFAVHDEIESLGINTREDLARVEQYLLARTFS